jgi:SAM-dependent methyltransferase
MNRKQRRAGMKRGGPPPAAAVDDWAEEAPTAELMAKARWHLQERQTEAARQVCNRILAREPDHAPALNLLGLILQEAGQHRPAVKEFKRAIAADDLDAACHYNLAVSYQALGRQEEAAAHFGSAITLGLSRRSVEDFVFLNPAISASLKAIDEQRLLKTSHQELLGKSNLRAIAGDVFLRCALEMVVLGSAPLERLLTFLRATLLGIVHARVGRPATIEDGLARLLCALAHQCFINEYVFAETEEEARQAGELRDLLMRRFAHGEDVAPALLAAVGAYMPLHALPAAAEMARRRWPDAAAGLVRRQIVEPLQDADAATAITALTPIHDGVSLKVMEQYAENPYPRWTINPLAALRAEWRSPPAPPSDGEGAISDILIAGCGTGQHVFQVVHNFPRARVLAIDISRPSLAYAQRKAREANLPNIEYAQADILQSASIGRSFDLIEAVGVLHHLDDPEQGWRVLLSLLRPNGEMRLGLYSEAARRTITAVRAFVAEQGYRPTVEDIRRSRQAIFAEAEQRRWQDTIRSGDFYSASGCRDLLFNVMEHRFTIARIKAFLDRERLTFLGFDLEKPVLDAFRQRFPADNCLTDLDLWARFETDNPQTFRQMYQFMVRRK